MSVTSSGPERVRRGWWQNVETLGRVFIPDGTPIIARRELAEGEWRYKPGVALFRGMSVAERDASVQVAATADAVPPDDYRVLGPVAE